MLIRTIIIIKREENILLAYWLAALPAQASGAAIPFPHQYGNDIGTLFGIRCGHVETSKRRISTRSGKGVAVRRENGRTPAASASVGAAVGLWADSDTDGASHPRVGGLGVSVEPTLRAYRQGTGYRPCARRPASPAAAITASASSVHPPRSTAMPVPAPYTNTTPTPASTPMPARCSCPW